MPTAGTLFRKQFRSDELLNTYDVHISHTSAIGVDRINRTAFESKLEQEIALINRKVLDGSYNFSQYREKLISKGAGKHPRVISIPTFRDRIVLRALCNILQQTFDDRIQQKIPQQVISALQESLDSGLFSHFIKIDITDFYPSISHKLLRKTLRGRIRKPELRSALDNAISSPTVAFPDKSKIRSSSGVPQGLAISNVLAEVFLADLDASVSGFPNVKYFRYVDDVLILCDGAAGELFKTIRHTLLSQFSLVAHPLGDDSKCRVGEIAEAFSFLGYQFVNTKAGVKKESILRVEGSLAKIFTTYKYKVNAINASFGGMVRMEKLHKARAIFLWRLNLRITGCIFGGARKGWVFYFSQISESNLFQMRKLDKTVSKLARRFDIKIEPNERKLFLRTYFEAKRRDPDCHAYIPNFDSADEGAQRRILAEYFGLDDVLAYPAEKVAQLFEKYIRRATQELEHDIQDIS